MNKTRHPEETDLLRYFDGELSAIKAWSVRRHIGACWECRAELKEFEATMSDCVRYRKSVLQTHLPPPPQPWRDLDRDFARIDSSMPENKFERWTTHLPVGSRSGWVVAAIAAMALIFILAYPLWRTPPVEASALLEKAAAAEQVSPHAPRRLQFRTKTGHFFRTAGGASKVSNEALPTDALFRDASYSSANPLSVAAYQSWRAGLGAKHDQVSEDRGPGLNSFLIRTTPESGPVADATLRLRMVDLRPAELRLDLQNRDWVEVTEAPVVDAPSAPLALNGPPASLPRTVTAETEHLTAPEPLASAALELQVASALHRTGADLGDPIEISRDGSRILVTGRGVPSGRQHQVRDALAALPNVVVRFTDPGLPPQLERGSPAGEETISQQPSSLQARLEAQLGGHSQFEKFSGGLFDRSEAAMARVYALRRLGREFPADTEGQLAPAERQALRGIGREHALSLASQIAEMQRTLAPVLGSPSSAPVASSDSATWQASAETLFQSCSRVEKQLAVLLGATPPDAALTNAPAALADSLARLQSDLASTQRLLSSDNN